MRSGFDSQRRHKMVVTETTGGQDEQGTRCRLLNVPTKSLGDMHATKTIQRKEKEELPCLSTSAHDPRKTSVEFTHRSTSRVSEHGKDAKRISQSTHASQYMGRHVQRVLVSLQRLETASKNTVETQTVIRTKRERTN